MMTSNVVGDFLGALPSIDTLFGLLRGFSPIPKSPNLYFYDVGRLNDIMWLCSDVKPES